MTVVITAGRIAALGKTGEVAIPEDALVVDATGKFLIPGLWDIHVHWETKHIASYLPLFIANGVTGVRNMGDPPEIAFQMRKAPQREETCGARAS